jgi:hypothetical protein
MASIAGTNVLFPEFRNAAAGKTSTYTYSSVLTNFTTTLYSFFLDNADTDPAEAHDFQSDLTTGETPAFAARHALSSVTVGAAGITNALAGVVDVGDETFTSTWALPAGDHVESFIIYKFITNAAASPLMAHYGSATGLPLTPNGADVTVVFNASGAYRF